ncbi:hypothetical protein BRYFOR_07185 [Marvinbryantia formatexigens DSM 14469]|uniref:Uncharacterized protein n=1 Tax=Marvinbryantia formatexigens DSM 14469 TaxID=478749 RepID=C6LEY4_9FIRM|nr:hypothetical protein BRYFOR_07185 [Marvinbryantia formatexigens DSM 14469]
MNCKDKNLNTLRFLKMPGMEKSMETLPPVILLFCYWRGICKAELIGNFLRKYNRKSSLYKIDN